VELSTLSMHTDLPIVSIDYGRTEAGEGLRPVLDSRWVGSKADETQRMAFMRGRALPIDPATRGDASFFPVVYPDRNRPVPSQTSGWWLEHRSDGRYVRHMPGEEPHTQTHVGVNRGDYRFRSMRWPVGLVHPLIIDDPEAAAEEAERAMRAVREMPEPWGAIRSEGNGLQQDLIIVGEGAVKAALAALADEEIGKSPMPPGFGDMLAAVQDGLEIPAP
jgi:hypothetical protein